MSSSIQYWPTAPLHGLNGAPDGKATTVLHAQKNSVRTYVRTYTPPQRFLAGRGEAQKNKKTCIAAVRVQSVRTPAMSTMFSVLKTFHAACSIHSGSDAMVLRRKFARQ